MIDLPIPPATPILWRLKRLMLPDTMEPAAGTFPPILERLAIDAKVEAMRLYGVGPDDVAVEAAKIRCGDSIRYTFPDGRVETWIVAYADYVENRLAWMGWPDGTVDLDKCEIVELGTDEQYLKNVAEWLDKPHARDGYGCEDRRVSYVRRLYRPEEHRRLNREARAQQIAYHEQQIVALRAAQEADA